jgi:hypothetical protein
MTIQRAHERGKCEKKAIYASPLWFRLSIGLISLTLILALPSGMPAWFNGLPWSGALETLVLTVFLPFLLLGRWQYLTSKKLISFLLCLLALKAILAIWAPSAGWNVKVYESQIAFTEGRWESTYESIWRNGVSAIMDRPWLDSKYFPIEWMNRYAKKKRQKRQVVLQIEGWAIMPKGEELVLRTDGARHASLWAEDSNGKRQKLYFKNGTSVKSLSGACKVYGEIYFGPGGNWTLALFLREAFGELTSAFDPPILWQGQDAVTMNLKLLAGLGWMARVSDMAILLFFAAWLYSLLLNLFHEGLLGKRLAFLATLGLVLPLAISWIPDIASLDPTGILPLAIGMSIGSGILATWAIKETNEGDFTEKKLEKLVIFVLGPGIVGYLCFNWWYHLGAMHFYSIGDDWLVYQNYGRQIFVGGDWWSSFEPLIFYQPGYRYIVGLLHALFGQSAMAQHMLDAWSVAGAAALLTGLARFLGAMPSWALIGCAIYLFNELAGGFRHHLGRSMSEHSSMLFMMLAFWGVARSRVFKPGRVLYPALAAMVGFWLRMDHLGALAGAGFFRRPGRGLGWLAAWSQWVKDLWQDLRWPLVYWTLLFLAAFAILARNKIMGGLFVLVDSRNVDRWDITSLYGAWVGLSTILNADDSVIKFPALVLWPGALVGLIALFWRRGPLSGYPLCLALAIAGALSPYVFLLPNGSPPRFSVHILPLACLSIVVAGQAGFNWWKGRPTK